MPKGSKEKTTYYPAFQPGDCQRTLPWDWKIMLSQNMARPFLWAYRLPSRLQRLPLTVFQPDLIHLEKKEITLSINKHEPYANQ